MSSRDVKDEGTIKRQRHSGGSGHVCSALRSSAQLRVAGVGEEAGMVGWALWWRIVTVRLDLGLLGTGAIAGP